MSREKQMEADNVPWLPQSQHLSFPSMFSNCARIFSFWLAIPGGLSSLNFSFIQFYFFSTPSNFKTLALLWCLVVKMYVYVVNA